MFKFYANILNVLINKKKIYKSNRIFNPTHLRIYFLHSIFFRYINFAKKRNHTTYFTKYTFKNR